MKKDPTVERILAILKKIGKLILKNVHKFQQ